MPIKLIPIKQLNLTPTSNPVNCQPTETTAGTYLPALPTRWPWGNTCYLLSIRVSFLPILGLLLAFVPGEAKSQGRHDTIPPSASIYERLQPITRYVSLKPTTEVKSAALRRPAALTRPSQSVFGQALKAATCAASLRLTEPKRMIGIIDYSRPSTETRLWIYDRLRNELLRSEIVAHGKNSGEDLATTFSNTPGSLMSSLGLFETGEVYSGEHGVSLRLHGLEPSINDLAYDRAIVLHGAPYVSKRFIDKYNRLGRSWGCPAVRQEVVAEVIEELRDDALLFSYFPDRSWLRHSKVLNSCDA